MRTIQHWVSGESAALTSTRTSPVFNPASGQQQAEVLMASAADVEAVVAVAREAFVELPITLRDGERAGSLPMLHKDPFDRMLIAQALADSLVLVSNEGIFDRYGVARLW